jgi:hypothetical protein
MLLIPDPDPKFSSSRTLRINMVGVQNGPTFFSVFRNRIQAFRQMRIRLRIQEANQMRIPCGSGLETPGFLAGSGHKCSEFSEKFLFFVLIIFRKRISLKIFKFHDLKFNFLVVLKISFRIQKKLSRIRFPDRGSRIRNTA